MFGEGARFPPPAPPRTGRTSAEPSRAASAPPRCRGGSGPPWHIKDIITVSTVKVHSLGEVGGRHLGPAVPHLPLRLLQQQQEPRVVRLVRQHRVLQPPAVLSKKIFPFWTKIFSPRSTFMISRLMSLSPSSTATSRCGSMYLTVFTPPSFFLSRSRSWGQWWYISYYTYTTGTWKSNEGHKTDWLHWDLNIRSKQGHYIIL